MCADQPARCGHTLGRACKNGTTVTRTGPAIWIAAGLRTPFVRVDGPFAGRDALALSVPVVQAMVRQVSGPIDFAVWGSVALDLAYSNLAREVWLEAGLDPHVPSFTTIMQCGTSMVGAFEAAGLLVQRGEGLALAGGVESMSRVRIGLGQNLSVWLRRLGQASGVGRKLGVLRTLRPRDLRLSIPEIKNRVTGKSMGEHCEEMAREWRIGRREQDELALQSHQRTISAQDAGFFGDLIVAVDGVSRDAFPRRDTSLEKLSELRSVFDRASGQGTLTAGNSSPLTDGAAALWVATEEGLSRLPPELPRAKLVDFEMAAVDLFREGLLMAPVAAIPRMLARRGLRYEDVALWEIHEAFAAQVLCNVKGLEDERYVREKSGMAHTFGRFPKDRVNPNGGSVAIGHPFGATGARILSQSVKELAAMPPGSRAIVSVCADGGEGTVALLEV
jgi:acetyl-CoA C-acetyltransferase